MEIGELFIEVIEDSESSSEWRPCHCEECAMNIRKEVLLGCSRHSEWNEESSVSVVPGSFTSLLDNKHNVSIRKFYNIFRITLLCHSVFVTESRFLHSQEWQEEMWWTFVNHKKSPSFWVKRRIHVSETLVSSLRFRMTDMIISHQIFYPLDLQIFCSKILIIIVWQYITFL